MMNSSNPNHSFINNRFFAVIAAAQRAHALQEGFEVPLVVLQEETKPTLIALEEIEQGKIDPLPWMQFSF